MFPEVAVGGDTKVGNALPAHGPVPPPLGSLTGDTAVNAHPVRALTLSDAVRALLRPVHVTDTVPDCTTTPDQLLPPEEDTVLLPVCPSVKLQLNVLTPV